MNYIDVPTKYEGDFCYVCTGDCMKNAGINNGDIAIVKAQTTVDNGQIAAVKIDGYNTPILKRVYKQGNVLQLIPDNPLYEPIVFIGEEVKKVQIIGRVTAVLKPL